MKWVVDSTNHFEWRPYYDQSELDCECERIVSAFLVSKYGAVNFPLSTDDLTVMVERDTSDLDLYADLSSAGEDVEGVTDFFRTKKPAVRIDRELSVDSSKYHRLRTTLAHEYAHVKLHSFLWEDNQTQQPAAPSNIAKKYSLQYRRYHTLRQSFSRGYSIKDNLPLDGAVDSIHKSGSCFSCSRDLLLDAPVSDWMEWQAAYACGALLMPVSRLQNVARPVLPGANGLGWIPAGSEKARELINQIARDFDVSSQAARVRLLKLGYLQIVP